MELIIASIVIIIIGIVLIPRIINWSHSARCPKCGKWFCLEYHSFVVTDKVVSQNTTRFGGGRRSGLLRGGFFWGTGHTKADPFIREWGEARYICRECGRKVAIRNVKRDR